MNRSRLRGRAPWVALVLFFTLAGLAALTPLTGVVIWFLPTPIIVFTVLKSKVMPPVLAVLTCLLLFAVGLGVASIVFALGLYFVGWVVGESINSAESAYPPLVTGTLVFVMLGLVALAFLRWSGVNVYHELLNQSRASLHLYQPMLQMTTDQSNQMSVDFADSMNMLIPAVLVIAGFLGALVNYVAACSLLPVDKGFHRPPILSTWRIPNWVAVVYIISMAFVLFGWSKSAPFLWHVINNAAVLSAFFILVQGIALVWRKVGKWPLRYLWLLLLAVLAALLSSLFILLGCVDTAWTRRNNSQR